MYVNNIATSLVGQNSTYLWATSANAISFALNKKTVLVVALTHYE